MTGVNTSTDQQLNYLSFHVFKFTLFVFFVLFYCFRHSHLQNKSHRSSYSDHLITHHPGWSASSGPAFHDPNTAASHGSASPYQEEKEEAVLPTNHTPLSTRLSSRRVGQLLRRRGVQGHYRHCIQCKNFLGSLLNVLYFAAVIFYHFCTKA